MDVQSIFEILEQTEKDISQTFYSKHPTQVHLAQGGIALILNGIELAGEAVIDLSKIDQFILRRYLSVIPFRANWIIKTLSAGFPSNALSLLRILFEEVVSMNYFLQKPDAARSAFTDTKYIEPGLTKKLNAVTTVSQYHVIAKYLSEGYIHPLINKASFLNSETESLPEPFYDPIVCNLGLDLLVFLVDRSAAHMEMFGLDKTVHEEWYKNLTLFLDDVKGYQSTQNNLLN